MNGMTIVEPRLQRAAVAPEALDDPGARLRDDPHGLRRDEQREHATSTSATISPTMPRSYSSVTSAVAPLISMTCTRVPGSKIWSSS